MKTNIIASYEDSKKIMKLGFKAFALNVRKMEYEFPVSLQEMEFLKNQGISFELKGDEKET